MIDFRRLVFVAAFALGVTPCLAKETVCLKSGFCLEADSHTSADGTFVFQFGQGTIEYPAGDIASIQPIAEPVAPAAPSAAVKIGPLVDAHQLLSSAANQQGLYDSFVLSVAKVESDLQAKAVSPKGALGLMQLMPGTAAELGIDPLIPSQNAIGGAKYLRALLLRYHGDSVLALAAYNAGPQAVDRFHGVPPFRETRTYVIRVLKEYARQQKLQASAGASKPTATN